IPFRSGGCHMKEPGKTYAEAVLIPLLVVWILGAPASLMAQRAGGQPYPPPTKTSQSSNQPYTSPLGTDSRTGTGNSSLESWRRQQTEDPETVLRRRRVAAELAEDFERLKRINRERIVTLASSSPLDYRALSQVA